jgi:putative transcriptional regulator
VIHTLLGRVIVLETGNRLGFAWPWSPLQKLTIKNRTFAVLPHPNEPSALDAILAGYACGSLSPALHALVGAHLELSAHNRGFVSALETTLGESVAAGSGRAIRQREARLDAIFAEPAIAMPRVHPCEAPRALTHFLGAPLDRLDFRAVLPGIRECRIDIDPDARAVLYRIRPGRKMPQHSHEGLEVTLVLKGGFTDATGHFRRGDMVVADEHLDHVPVADADEECICFAVMDAPLKLTGTFGRLINRFVRH